MERIGKIYLYGIMHDLEKENGYVLSPLMKNVVVEIFDTIFKDKNHGWNKLTIDYLPPTDKPFDAWINGQRFTNMTNIIVSSNESQFESLKTRGIEYWRPLPSAPFK